MEDIDKEPVKSKKDLLLEKLKSKHPDLNADDEDSFYGRINDDYDENEKRIGESSKNEEALSNLFSSDPRSAHFLMSWKNGENPVVQLIRQFGDDFKEALDDPDMQEQFAAAHNEYLDRQLNNKKIQDEAEANLPITLKNLEDAQSEGGYDEKQADEAFQLIFDIIDNGNKDLVTKETWIMAFKALNHDSDVATAAHEAEIKGKNAKIDKEKKKTTVPADLPPMIGGQGGEAPAPKKRNLGFLDKVTDDNDIWNRGKRK